MIKKKTAPHSTVYLRRDEKKYVQKAGLQATRFVAKIYLLSKLVEHKNSAWFFILASLSDGGTEDLDKAIVEVTGTFHGFGGNKCGTKRGTKTGGLADRPDGKSPLFQLCAGHFLTLDRNRKQRMKSLWHPGYLRPCFWRPRVPYLISSSPSSRVPKSQVPKHASQCPVRLSPSLFYTHPCRCSRWI